MRIISGRGQDLDDLTIHQWANDWISYNGGPNGGGVINPRHVLLSAEEVAHVRACRDRGDHSGRFWAEWDLADDGRFAQRGQQ